MPLLRLLPSSGVLIRILYATDNEKRLGKKVRELGAELVDNTAKVAAALKLSDEDSNTINALRKEVEKAWKLVDAGQEKVISHKGRDCKQLLAFRMLQITL